ncbi:trans-sulfuration enzyme family protein [Fodinibius halophilus]|uniref:O-succinylhomoserine sulfhydrylase n=1 Tax=Fodinibius halophilus TaxID=1736908 RepID=A0A6M1T1U3_9BACT|nr:aminotransferase class I/II-fold pyridoxal phosphate-dependent enzyme [Fodinibius halophilus]NGP89446.1 aminotransferase class I/II-fold pyridoxal phosphate-dependent enzyme [Fodinibius halophilus]
MSDQQPETKAIRNQTERTDQREHSTPLFLTSSFVFDSAEHARALFAREVDGNVYSRYSNPNIDEFVTKMCDMEEAEAGVATASGMSSIFSTLAGLLEQGDHVLACRSLFGSSHQILSGILPKWGIDFSYGSIDDTESWESLIQDNTRVLFLETPSNPGLDLIDLEWAGKLADAHNLILIVDNCFATPYLQQPMKYGADLVLHSATKFIDGQGRGLGGIAVGKERYIDEISFFCRHSGPALSPFNAWMFSKSLETLPMRMDRHCDNALALAEELQEHVNVEWVKYPYLPSHPQYELAKKQMKKGGGVVSFNIKGGYEAAKNFLDKLNTISLSANLGDSRSIATHPASTTHSKLTEEERLAVNITPGMVRIAVGLEAVEDIIADVNQALA